MNISELTQLYIAQFRKAPNSKYTKQCYRKLQNYARATGKNLNKEFFQRLLDQHEKNPKKFDKPEKEIEKMILLEMQAYMYEQAHIYYVHEIKDRKLSLITGINKSDDSLLYNGFFKGIPFTLLNKNSEYTLLEPKDNSILCEILYKDTTLKELSNLEKSTYISNKLKTIDTSNFKIEDPAFPTHKITRKKENSINVEIN